MMRRLISCLCVLLVALAAVGPAESQAQQREDLPEEVQRELEERGLTVQEARRRMQQLGIDPSDPQQAAQRARELGVPEARIQSLLRAAGALQAGQERGEIEAEAPLQPSPAPSSPFLAGTPVVRPGSLSVDQLPVAVEVQVPLRSRSRIQRVRPFFRTARGDSARAMNVTRTRGTNREGTWRGTIVIPSDARVGSWGLYVRASTLDTTVALPTGRRLQVFPEGALRKAGRDTLQYFGYDTFKTIPQAFTPQPTGPAGGNYIVGPNDELRLTVWGGAEFTYELQVDREGRVTVPNVGQFTVAGKRLDELRTEMKQWLSRSYSGLTSDPPTVFMDLSLTRVRPTQVFIMGEVGQPGGYMVNSYATVFNALYSVGGPLKRGSLRNIKVIRDGEVVSTVDLYNLLVEGRGTGSVQLQSNDYIFVPPRGETVAITGAVQRPAYYEIKDGETVADLLEYAGGLKPKAYTKRFQINRIVPFDEREDPSVARTLKDVSLEAVRADSVSVALEDGDHVRILTIAEASDPAVKARLDAVEVSGAVLKPGQYELGDGVRTIRDLIKQADGLTGAAYREQAELVRIDDTLSETTRSIDLGAAMEDQPQSNVVLQPGDSLHVLSVQEMRSKRTVRITGEVRDPGNYRYREGMTIRNLLLKAGGLTDDEYLKDVFLGRADLFRVSSDGDEKRVIPFHLGEALEGAGMADRTLRPEDEIRIYPATVERLDERFVKISGAVQDTGRYAYRDNMTLKDLILQANGFTEGASLRKVNVTRMVEQRGEDGLRANTIEIPLIERDVDPEDVNFSVKDTIQAMAAAEDFELQHRDRVFVRQDPAFQPQRTVTVRGEVAYPGEYTLLRDNERLSNVIDRAGGILPTGYLKGGRLLRPAEQADQGVRSQQSREQVIVEMSRAVRGNPEEDVILRPGDEIVIPTQPNTVAVRGNVANEGLIKHEAGRKVDYYLDRAGGTRDSTQAIYLTQASGATFRVDTGWFRRTPEVDDGAVIRVAREEPRRRDSIDYGQIATEAISVLSSALTVIVLATRAFD